MERFTACARQLPASEQLFFAELAEWEKRLEADEPVDHERCLLLSDVADLLAERIVTYQGIQFLSADEVQVVLQSRVLAAELEQCLPSEGDAETRKRTAALLAGEWTYVLEHAPAMPPYAGMTLPEDEMRLCYSQPFPTSWSELEQQIQQRRSLLEPRPADLARAGHLEAAKAMLERAGFAETDEEALLLLALGCQEEFEDFRQLVATTTRQEIRTLIAAVMHRALIEGEEDDDDGDMRVRVPSFGPWHGGSRPQVPTLAP